MKIWSIKFAGIFPVGSAAIVCTSDFAAEQTACDLFREQWAKEHPQGPEAPEASATLLDCPVGAVHILNDGDY